MPKLSRLLLGLALLWAAPALADSKCPANQFMNAQGYPPNACAQIPLTAIPLFTPTQPGLVPLSGGGTVNYLRADGTWNAPPGGGGGSPAGATGAIQWNNVGSFAGTTVVNSSLLTRGSGGALVEAALLPAINFPALTGDVTTPGSSLASTLAIVNSNVGTFQGLTLDAKGRVIAAIDQAYAPLASPALTGAPTTPTPGSNVNTTQVVNGTWVNTYYAPLLSPALLGNPTAPTQTAGDNTTKIANDAFVTTAVAAGSPLAFYFHKNGTNQTSIPNAAYTQVTWSTTKFNNTGNALASNRWTAPSTGYVHFSFELYLNADVASTGQNIAAKLTKNSAGTCNGTDVFAGIGVFLYNSAGLGEVNASADDAATAGDVYELCLYMVTADGLAGGGIDGNLSHTYWAGHYIH